MKQSFELPYFIGQVVYMVKEYNKHYPDKEDKLFSKGNDKIKICKLSIEGFIIDDDGIHVAESGLDGWTPITVYNYMPDRKNCVLFETIEGALEYVKYLGYSEWNDGW